MTVHCVQVHTVQVQSEYRLHVQVHTVQVQSEYNLQCRSCLYTERGVQCVLSLCCIVWIVPLCYVLLCYVLRVLCTPSLVLLSKTRTITSITCYTIHTHTPLSTSQMYKKYKLVPSRR